MNKAIGPAAPFRRLALAGLFLLLAAAISASGADEEYAPPRPDDDRFFLVILDDGGRAAYEALAPEDRESWRRRYWASVDPTPTTDENQREMEHQRRVVEAMRLFRNKHDRFVFDDRARAYIRFGKPERRESLEGEVVIHRGLLAPREFWLYGDMILWFEDRRLNGTYEEGLTTTASGIGGADQNLREDTGWQVDEELEFEESFERFLEVRDIEVDPVLAKRYAEDGAHRWRRVVEVNEYEPEGKEEIRFIFDVSYLAGDAGRTDMLIGFLVSLDGVESRAEGGVETARLQRQSALYTPDYDLVDRKVADLSRARGGDPDDSGWIVTADSFRIDPGSYVLALRLVDPVSKNEGSFKAPVSVPSFAGDSIRISDIVFADDIGSEDRGQGGFARGTYRIVPRPIRVFGMDERVRIYFEVYNISTDADGRGRYEVEYTLFGTKAGRGASFFGGSHEGKLELGISEPYQTQSAGPTASRHITFDVSTLPDDRYTLTVDVTDLSNGSADRATAQFVVKR